MALHLLRHMTRSAGADVVIATGSAASATAALADGPPHTVLIAAVGPRGLTEACYLCRRLGAQYPGVRILVGRWGRGRSSEKARRRLLAAGAYRVVGTLQEAATELIRTGHSQPSVEHPEAV